MQNSIFSEEFSVNHTNYDIRIHIFIQIKLWLKKVAKYLWSMRKVHLILVIERSVLAKNLNLDNVIRKNQILFSHKVLIKSKFIGILF